MQSDICTGTYQVVVLYGDRSMLLLKRTTSTIRMDTEVKLFALVYLFCLFRGAQQAFLAPFTCLFMSGEGPDITENMTTDTCL